MSEVGRRVDAFLQGETIAFGFANELHQFENDLVAARLPINAQFNLIGMWENRPPTKELIKPKGFNGRILGIAITPIENAYEALVEQFPGRAKRTKRTYAWALENTIGYHILGTMRSSSQNYKGTLESRVWITQRIPYADAATSTYSNTAANYGIYDRVIQPANKHLGKTIQELQEEAKAIGRQVLGHGLSHPISGGLPGHGKRF